MIHEFMLADIGEGLDEAEIVTWLVAPGDRVERDQGIVEVLTDKSNAELPAPVGGTVVSIAGEIGDMVPVGSILATIDDGGSDVVDSGAPRQSGADSAPQIAPQGDAAATTFRQAAASVAQAAQVAQEPSAPGQAPTADQEPAALPPRPKASPSTRREAARLGVDLSAISGTGPGGRIIASDLDGPADRDQATPVEATPTPTPPAATSEPDVPIITASASQHRPPPVELAGGTPAPQTAPLNSETVPLRGVRRAIANNMARSWSTIPHIHTFEQIDAEPLMAFRTQLRKSGRSEFADVTPLSLLVAAVADAMARHPEANASLDLEAATITSFEHVNVGIAVATERGLVVPIIRNAERLTLAEVAAEVRRVVTGARQGGLDRDSYVGGTVTITNFGSLGGEQASPLIRPPESVIFGFGSIAARPWIFDDEVVARSTMHTVLGADHRLLDGDVATSLLRAVNGLLQSPINLLIGG